MIIPNWMQSHKIPWFQTTNQLWLDIGSSEFLVGGFNASENHQPVEYVHTGSNCRIPMNI
jgi:hypothetical protein